MAVAAGPGRIARARTVGRPTDTFYPSPFFDVAQQYLPKTLRETFDWCTFYFLTNPFVATVIVRLATYPITEVIYEDDEAVTRPYRDLFHETLKFRTFLVEMNLDRYCFGNAYASVAYPFDKVLTCKGCRHSVKARDIKYKWRGYNFSIVCPKCGWSGNADVRDEFIKSPEKIRLIRWHPKNIQVETNELTGRTVYYYDIPKSVRNDVTLGLPHVIEGIPQTFIDAIRLNKAVMLRDDKLFHMRRPCVSREAADNGVGLPIVLPVLKDLYLMQILKKSQEAVALEHILPMRALFPQVTADSNNVYAHVNLQNWQKEVEGQVTRWRNDPNHMPVMPVPLGYQLIGGNGRAYMLHQEIRSYGEQVIAGMGVPTAFVFGEAQYSGASVNLRALENEFLGNRDDMLRLVTWAHKGVAQFLTWPEVIPRFKPFKMADDLQRASFDMQLVGQKIMSKRTFAQSRDLDYATELEIIREENQAAYQDNREGTLAQTTTQGEAMLVQTRYQGIAQQQQQAAMPQPVDPNAPQGGEDPNAQGQVQGIEQSPISASNGGSMTDLISAADGLVRQLQAMSVPDRYSKMQAIRAQSPDLYRLVSQRMGSGSNVVDMRALPEKLPPRRDAANAAI